MKFAPVTLLLSFALCAAAQQPFQDPVNLRGERVAPLTGRELPIDQGSRGLEQMLRKLNTRASLMLIDAHPDDEDGGMLTLYSRGLGANVALMTLNRGEGGQNAMTGDFEDALGLLRTQELLAADRYYDVEQMFGTEVDFGFSKTKEESFQKWGHRRVLYDVVRAIRLYRPLVIAAVFVGGVTDGHGQHQVSGEIAQEVFKAAGDPKIFPELTAEGILPWQPLKVYARVPRGAITSKGLFDYATGHYTPARFVNYVTGKVTTTTPSIDVMVHEGKVDPLLAEPNGTPRSYVQFARIGLGMQKSQIGPGMRLPTAGGAYDVGYHLYGSRVGDANSSENAGTFFSGIDTSVMGIATLAPDAFPAGVLATVSGEIEAATRAFDPKNPSAVAPELASALKDFDLLIKDVAAWKGDAVAKENALHELRVKRVQLEDALRLAYGVRLNAFDLNSTIRQGLVSPLTVHISAPTDDACKLQKVWLTNAIGDVPVIRALAETTDHAPLENRLLTDTTLKIPLLMPSIDTMVITRPYFERKSIEASVYELRDPAMRNAPQSMPAAVGHARVRCGSATFELSHIAQSVEALYYPKIAPQAVMVVPTLNVSLSERVQALPIGDHSFKLTVSDHSFGSYAGFTRLCFLGSCVSKPSAYGKKPGDRIFKIDVLKRLEKTPFVITAFGFSNVSHRTSMPADGYRAVGYGDLPRTNYYTPATDRVVPVDLKLPTRRRIGYLAGTGDAVPEALISIGLAPTMLHVSDLTAAKLAGFDTVILGVRAYNAHPDLHGAPTDALLQFARGGGNVVVQYQTGEFTGADAPYPLTLGYRAEKVIVEGDPVKLLKPNASLLQVPNAITAADFDGWIEERGHGFLGTWDNRYDALTEVHDPGQTPQEGGLVTVKLGKGRWTYCAFALYRQLPEAVPGAYRVFVNLLAP